MPIDTFQTVSQPFMVALMLQVAELKPGDHVLEIGTGSGYAAAVLAELVERINTVERHAVLADSARERLAALGYRNVVVHALDGTLGLPQAAPFDAIIAAASGPGCRSPGGATETGRPRRDAARQSRCGSAADPVHAARARFRRNRFRCRALRAADQRKRGSRSRITRVKSTCRLT
ncbi:protein-L-isoaspartate O-methyltransferase family protein [Paraburkholderia sp. WC7.3g]|uniref:protein-L-isoaspartate O-methyltransferase family protein n=1 Tax=Paraburkholderia sp. WC7.3g TaxID=2991070 RepID=UPI003D23D0FB